MSVNVGGNIQIDRQAVTPVESVPRAFLVALVDAFLQFEVDHELFAIKVRGRTFWDYVRYRVFEELVGPVGGFDSPGLVFRRRRPVVSTARALAVHGTRTVVDKFARPTPYDVVLVSSIPGRYWRGTRADAYMYPIACALKPRWRTLVFNHLDRHLNAADYVCDVMDGYPAHVAHALSARFASWSAADKTAFDSIGKRLHERFGVRVDMSRLARVFAVQIADEESFGRVLDRTQPRAIVYCDTGAVKGLIRAAHLRGVRVVEFQHAAMSLDVRYRYGSRVPRADITETLPDEILTFGEHWHDQHALPVTTRAVGLPALDLWRGSGQFRSPAAEVAARSKRLAVLSVMNSRRELARVALELAARLPDFEISFKLRHDEYDTWRADYPREFQTTPNLTVVGNELSLHECLERNAYQVSTNSTALYEGMYFGLTTFVLAASRYEEMMPVIAADAAFLVFNAGEIADAVRRGEAPRGQLDPEQLFRSSSLSHIERALAEVLQQPDGPSRVSANE